MATHSAIIDAPGSAVGWRWRLGLRAQLAASLVLLLIVGGIAANAYLSTLYSPAGAVHQYLTALGSGDAGAAWAAMTVASPASGVSTSLVDHAALAAALGRSHPAISEVSVGSVQTSGAASVVDVSYRLGIGLRHDRLGVAQSGQRRLSVYPTWQVIVQPAIYQLTLPIAAGALSMDGRAVTIATDKAQTIAVLPLKHQLETAGSVMEAPFRAELDSTLEAGVSVPVAVTPTLTAAGQTAAKKAVLQALTGCAASTELKPAGCPQSSSDTLVDQVSWKLVGDPTSDLVVAADSGGSLAASGHYQMVLADHPSYGSGFEHAAVGGAYTAPLMVSPTDVRVTSVALGQGVAAVSRPAGATDQAAKDLVAAAFAACAAATTVSVNDCPQTTSLVAIAASNVRWTLGDDPLAGATVSFDSGRSVFSVAGPLSMAIDFDMQGGHYHANSDTNRYRADLLWDGSKLQLVTIQGVLS